MVKERAFLHSVANPLATAKFILDMVLEDYPSLFQDNPNLIIQLKQVADAIDEATKIISERREEILKAEQAVQS